MRFHRPALLHGFMVAVTLCSNIASASASPPVIDDRKLIGGLQTFMKESVGKNGCPSADDLRKSAEKANHQAATIPLPDTAPPNSPSYDELSRSVFLIGSIYKCGKCHEWHKGSGATAWCLGEDGLMVTNAHVFKNAKGGAMAVSDREGHCYPISELLGIDVATDVALFRVKAKGLKPLPLGSAPDVGSPVTVISNPSGHCFLHTSGTVARYASLIGKDKKTSVTWMTITADYAKGSSGGPVFNEAGEVVGMVSNTRSIHATPSARKSPQPANPQLQMVIRNSVPVDAIRRLFPLQASADPTGTD